MAGYLVFLELDCLPVLCTVPARQCSSLCASMESLLACVRGWRGWTHSSLCAYLAGSAPSHRHSCCYQPAGLRLTTSSSNTLSQLLLASLQLLAGVFENLHSVRLLDINLQKTSFMMDRLADAHALLW